MRLTRSLAGALLASTTIAAAGYAETPDTPDTVVIYGLRFEQTEAEAGTAITVIGGADIQRRGLVFAGDAVAIAPGVTVTSSGAFGGVSYARMRGNAAGQTLVLVDGVPVNDVSSPGGGFDFGTFDLADVDRIEVLRGPQSTLWGSDAIGGVISIVTRAPEPGVAASAFGELGSFRTVRGGGAVSAAGDVADGRLSAVWQQSDGISKADRSNGNDERDGYESLTLAGRGGFRIAEGVRADVTARWTDAEFDLDGFPPPDYALSDTAATSASESLAGSATLTALAMGGRLQNVLQVARMEIDRSDDDGSGFVTPNGGDRTSYRYSGALRIAEGHRAGAGLEREESTANSQSASTNSLFGYYEWSPLQGLTLTGGVRYDDDDRYGSETTGRAAISWAIGEAVRLRASAGQGFKAPTIFQSTYICGFCGLTEPNADLKAETSIGADAGIDFSLGGVEVSVTAFAQETENLIDFSFSAGYDNIALAKQRGVEVEAYVPLVAWAAVSASYAYIDAEDGAGNDLPRVPVHSGDLELIFWPAGPTSASLAVRHNGEQSDGFGPRVPGWTRADLSGVWRITDAVELYGRIENLLDEDYQQIGGYGTPGRSGHVGFRVKG